MMRHTSTELMNNCYYKTLESIAVYSFLPQIMGSFQYLGEGNVLYTDDLIQLGKHINAFYDAMETCERGFSRIYEGMNEEIQNLYEFCKANKIETIDDVMTFYKKWSNP